MSIISVIIPTYNRGSTVSRAIDSALSQTYNDIEIIVVDDNSTDNTEKIVAGYENKVRYIKHEQNKGAAAARNTGVRESIGDFIAFIDSDDEWHPDKLKKQITKFQQSPSKVGVVYTGYYKKHNSSKEIGRIPSKKGDIFKMQLMQDWVNPTSTVLIKKKCFEKAGGFDPSLSARQDYDLWIRIARHCHFEYIREPLVTLYTDRQGRITDDIDQRMRAHYNVLESIENDICSLPWHQRRQAFGRQHYTMGRYLQKHSKFKRAIRHLGRSLRWYPLNWRGLVCIVLAVARLDTNNSVFVNIKNKIRSIILS